MESETCPLCKKEYRAKWVWSKTISSGDGYALTLCCNRKLNNDGEIK